MKKIYKIKGMHCNSCATLIENTIRDKVESIKVSYANETAEIDFDENKISEHDIKQEFLKLGYDIAENKKQKKDFTAVIVIGLSVVLCLAVLYVLVLRNINIPEVALPEIGENASLILLFIAGLFTGLHCISMCGGFVVSYSAKNAIKGHKGFKQHLVYGGAKVISYAIIGALFGLIGGFIAFNAGLRGAIAIFAGLFMMFYALSMFGFKFFKRFQFNPKFLTKIASKKTKGHYKGPFFTGLLNGLFIACGPLQAMYLYAAGTGDAIKGAMSLAVFGLGTLPVMIGFGGLTTIISHKTTGKILKVSAIIVLILGLVMLNRGLSLTGSGYDFQSVVSNLKGANGISSNVILENGYQIIKMDVTRQGWEPDQFVLKKDVPVKWIINGKEINGCNDAIQVPKLGLEFDIEKGEQTIEFTPTEEGVISWSCWMGMIPGTFIVTDDGGVTQEQINSANSVTSSPGSCGGSCGSPTCGGGTSKGCGCGG